VVKVQHPIARVRASEEEGSGGGIDDQAIESMAENAVHEYTQEDES
jgi:hypothetical protein